MSEAGKKRILLVDDSKFVRTTFKTILSRSFAVVEAPDGEAGWEAIRGDPTIVLVFSDLNMPKLDGFGLLARVRKAEDPRLRQLPVVVISGNEDDGAKKKARAAGANDFISKTADGTEILARIENLLKLADTAQMATHDAVSGALTLHYLITEGRKHMSAAKRHESPLSVMVVSIDNHGELATTLGEQAAGEVLKRIAALIGSGMRAEDSLGRTGAATFTLVSAGTSAPQALAFARRLQERLQSAQIRLAGKVHSIRASFGVSSLGVDAVSTIEDLMKRAIERMRKSEVQPPAPAAPPPAVPAIAAAALPADVEMAMKLLETAAGRVTEARPTLIQRLQKLMDSLKAKHADV
jgi:two-component system cell cycle response regulator